MPDGSNGRWPRSTCPASSKRCRTNSRSASASASASRPYSRWTRQFSSSTTVGGLDPRARRGLIELLDTLPQTLIASTHDMRLVRDLFTRRSSCRKAGSLSMPLPTDIIHDEALLEPYGLEAP